MYPVYTEENQTPPVTANRLPYTHIYGRTQNRRMVKINVYNLDFTL